MSLKNQKFSEYKKSLLYRKAGGKKIFAGYLVKVKYILDDDAIPEFLSLEETDSVINNFMASTNQLTTEIRNIPPEDLPGEMAAVSHIGGRFYILIDEDWRQCGLLEIDDIGRINTGVSFGKIISNDISLIAHDFSFFINFDFYENNGIYRIEVTQRSRRKQGRQSESRRARRHG